jgi:Beta propeller domain
MFTTVRFFDTIAYAVTFERTDPFYVLDLSDDENPTVLGELEIPGFSSYLHSINAANTKLVAVGQHANDDGIVLGLKISLFDATSPTQPRLIAEHLEEKQENTYSSSEVEWDQQAFRYLNLGSEMGRIIIPMSIYVWNNGVWPMPIAEDESDTGNSSSSSATTSIAEGESFDGFVVFSVANDTIERQFYISHADQTVEATNSYYNPGCWACGWLNPRSFVFNGDVVTMKGQSILRTDLDTGDSVWDTHLNDKESGLSQCCGY